MTRRHHDLQALYTRRRFLVGSALAAVPLSAWWMLDRPGNGATTTLPPADGSVASVFAKQVDPEHIESGALSGAAESPPSQQPAPSLDHDLVVGNVGTNVGLLQQRLTDLAFDPGPVDDYFGEATLRSVWAFEKHVIGTPRDQATGVVTPDLWSRLHSPVEVAPRRSPGGTHLEVYLPAQVAALFEGGTIRLVTHVSSGAGVEWCDEVTIDEDDGTQTTKGICGLSTTPGGVYHFERKVEGWRNAKLGRLYKPIYFNYGIAVHGATNVPDHPASRGCVRFPMHIAEYFQELVELGDMVYVFDGVEEPEHYGAQPMIFDWPDPDYSTTTTSTTTSTTAPSPTTSTTAPWPTTSTTTTTTSPSTTSTTTSLAPSEVATTTSSPPSG